MNEHAVSFVQKDSWDQLRWPPPFQIVGKRGRCERLSFSGFSAVDNLGRGHDIQDAFSESRAGRMTAVVEGGLDEGGAGVFRGNVFNCLWGGGAIVETEGAGVIVGFFRVGELCQSGYHELVEPRFIDFAGGAIEGPILVVEIREVVVDICGLFHGELEKSFLSVMVDHESEVPVREEFVGDFLDLPLAKMFPGFLMGHVEGDDVADPDILRQGFPGGEAL